MSSTDDNQEINALLSDIPQRASTLGEPVAPVALEYFGDLECPYCRDFSLEVLPSLIRRWVRTGNVRIDYRSLQTATGDPDAEPPSFRLGASGGAMRPFSPTAQTSFDAAIEELLGEKRPASRS
jgi:hypothetical protein